MSSGRMQWMEMERILEIYEVNTTSKKNLQNCHNIYPGYFYRFQIQKERRMHSIRLRTSDAEWNRLKNAVLTFQGWVNNQTKFEDLNVSRTNHDLNFSSRLVLTGYSESYFKNFRFTSNEWFRICEILVFAYHDECGHPEVPLHGHVKFESGDTKAIYRCDDGQMKSIGIVFRDTGMDPSRFVRNNSFE
jgi:hypothetical protein